MGKFKMPTVEEFVATKRMYEDKKDPPWVYIENEMRANIDKKPYNEKVGEWLKFYKDLKLHYFREALRQKRRLHAEAGPKWFCQLSNQQRLILGNLKQNIHQDLLEDRPVRVRKALYDLGCQIKVSNEVFIEAMMKSIEDPGIFIWELYTYIYKMPPSEPRKKYDLNAILLMSALVFIDLEETTKILDNMSRYKSPPPAPPKKRPPKKKQPYTRYGEYLDKMKAVCYIRKPEPKRPAPKPLSYKFKLRSKESYEELRQKPGFLKRRQEEAVIEGKPDDRECHYKFWEPPSALRNTDPKMAAYVKKLKMLKMKPKARHKAPYDNIQYLVGGVSFTGDRPRYIVQNVSLLPTGYIPLNGGNVYLRGELITNIQGYWKFPRDFKQKCDTTCDCVAKWESKVMDNLKETTCKCRHLYDFKNEGTKPKEKYFHPPTKHAPFWIDHAKINQLDPTEDFIKDTVKDALMSQDPTPEQSKTTVSAATLKPKELLQALLADLTTTTPLILPHLPNANLLPNLQEWVRKRVKGEVSPKKHKKIMLTSQRRWMELNHIDFKALAYRIPFTLKQLEHMNWDQRGNLQKLFNKLLQDFIRRNRKKQLEQTRLWWSTTQSYIYPSEAFLNLFFTYFPARMQDTFVFNPYCSGTTPKSGAKTCPLNL